METLAEKRQRFHRLLLQLGEAAHKEDIVSSFFPGITSTSSLDIFQMNVLLKDAEQRAGIGYKARRTAAAKAPETAAVRKLRNKCLLVLAERGIRATAKDWSDINAELAAKRYQWILSDAQREQGLTNLRGLTAFTTVEDLQKLFRQLCKIRDMEQLKTKKQ